MTPLMNKKNLQKDISHITIALTIIIAKNKEAL
jgi:hypothetical protein